MPTPSHRSDELVRFDGVWTNAERIRVRRAIERLETPDLTAPAASSLAWLCVRHMRAEATLYFAHWLRRPLVLTARSSEELVAKIDTLRPDAPAP